MAPAPNLTVIQMFHASMLIYTTKPRPRPQKTCHNESRILHEQNIPVVLSRSDDVAGENSREL